MKEFKQTGSLGFDERLSHSAQPTDKLQVFQSRKVVIEICLLRDIAKNASKCNHILVNILPFEEHPAIVCRNIPVMILTVVDLPAPFGPRNPTISPDPKSTRLNSSH